VTVALFCVFDMGRFLNEIALKVVIRADVSADLFVTNVSRYVAIK